jgi:hypothetical protein
VKATNLYVFLTVFLAVAEVVVDAAVAVVVDAAVAVVVVDEAVDVADVEVTPTLITMQGLHRPLTTEWIPTLQELIPSEIPTSERCS